MKLNERQFLGVKAQKTSFEESQVVIVPFGYEGGVSYGEGTAEGPEAIIDASYHLEIYDEELDKEPCEIGICTLEPKKMPSDGAKMVQTIYQATRELLKKDLTFFILVVC